ncbi:MAG: septum formation initiator family protein [Ruminococcus sp.]|nr:septum formation initiator family protein [Ruminococcus sp.]
MFKLFNVKKTTKKQNEDYLFEDNEFGIKEIKPKKTDKRKYILLYIAIIGFAFYAVITIVSQNSQIAAKRAELKEINQQINVVEIQTQYSKKVLNYEGDERSEYIEKIAKEELGYVSEGERIFINVAGD